MIRAIAALLPGKSQQRPTRPRPSTCSIPPPLYASRQDRRLLRPGLAYEQAGRYAEAQQDLQKMLDLKTRSGPDLVLRPRSTGVGRVSIRNRATPPRPASPIRTFSPPGKTPTPTCRFSTKPKPNTQNCSRDAAGAPRSLPTHEFTICTWSRSPRSASCTCASGAHLSPQLLILPSLPIASSTHTR